MHTLQTCPVCLSEQTTTIRTRTIRQGVKLRRHSCHACGHRWSTYRDAQGQELSAPPPRVPRPRREMPHLRKLTRADVHRILSHPDLSLWVLAQELGVSRELVRHVRIGHAYAALFPELPRQQPKPRKQRVVESASCLRCVLWRDGQCGYGFPDPEEEGPGFAADCDHYAPA